MVSFLGALLFFKFFSVVDGTVLEKKIDSGLFQNISYKVIVKTVDGKEKKKRIKAGLFDMLKKDDHLEKKAFSFTYRVNDKEVQSVTSSRFLLGTLHQKRKSQFTKRARYQIRKTLAGIPIHALQAFKNQE